MNNIFNSIVLFAEDAKEVKLEIKAEKLDDKACVTSQSTTRPPPEKKPKLMR